MNPLTLVKRIQNLNSREAALGISENASWHAKYKDSAYVYVGGVPFDLTEGDLLAVFAQYGEIVDVNLVRDKGTGKSKGFAFIAYEDQRSTNLAVDNLNGAQILGRTVRVDHVANYKKREEEDEETAQQKREARGVCRAFQRGECTRGAGCKFSHDEQRAANTGWGQEDKSSKWGHDKYEDPRKSERGENERSSDSRPEQIGRRDEKIARSDDYEAGQKAREYQYNKDHRRARRYEDEEFQPKSRPYERQEKRARRHGDEKYSSKSIDSDDKMDRKRSRRHESGSDVVKEDRRGGRERMRDSDDERDMMSSRRRESESDHVKEDRRERERMTTRDRDSSSHRGKDRNDNSRKPYDG